MTENYPLIHQTISYKTTASKLSSNQKVPAECLFLTTFFQSVFPILNKQKHFFSYYLFVEYMLTVRGQVIKAQDNNHLKPMQSFFKNIWIQ